MKLSKRELVVIDCALRDYEYQFINDTSRQDLMTEINNLITKIGIEKL